MQKYHEYNVEVVRKDGLLLVRELAAEVKNHMDFKINAVMVSAYITLHPSINLSRKHSLSNNDREFINNTMNL